MSVVGYGGVGVKNHGLGGCYGVVFSVFGWLIFGRSDGVERRWGWGVLPSRRWRCLVLSCGYLGGNF